MKEDEMEGACGVHAAELNVVRRYRRGVFYDLYVKAVGNR